MTNERDKTDAAADEAVSRAYREIAVECVPESLDRAVMQMAERAARPGYARSRAWARPLAWAATIVLSVAIVLELTRAPAPQPFPAEEAVPATDAVQMPPPASPATGSAPPAGRSADVMQGAREKSSLLQKSAAPAVVGSGVSEQRREADTPVPEEGSVSSPADFSLRDRTSAGPGVGELRELQGTAAPRAASSAQQAAVPVDDEITGSDPVSCPPEATRQPSTWLECIEDLKSAGMVDEATVEQRRLREAFPGIELP